MGKKYKIQRATEGSKSSQKLWDVFDLSTERLKKSYAAAQLWDRCEL